MYIKQITIQGFRSYRDQTVTQPFSPQSNVIVGRNGSGKSNFFAAIEFVLSDKFTNLREEERRGLLHEGTGQAVLSAFVEIVFDNTDGRLPTDRAEVALRRTIGLKKDEFRLDSRILTYREVVNILESAGFSRSNPYYIVQQGKVKSLAMMKDQERLDLLKEVAGTRVYDEKREESLKIMEETQSKRQRIVEYIEQIRERLDELEEEKDELKEYQELDRQKRALEYTIYNRDLNDAKQELEAVEELRQEETLRVQQVNADSSELESALRTKERELKQLETELHDMQKEAQILEEERTNEMEEKTRIELQLKDNMERYELDQMTGSDLAAELDKVRKDIEQVERRLQTVKPTFEQHTGEEQRAKEQIGDIEQRLAELYAKEGRRAQFKSKAARDKWLKAEITKLEKTLEARIHQLESTRSEVQKNEKMIQEAKAKVGKLSNGSDSRKAEVEELRDGLLAKKLERDTLSNKRKSMWKKERETEDNEQAIRRELLKNEQRLQSMMSRDVCAGLKEVRQLTLELQLMQKVYGPLIELFECPDAFMLAAEVTAGGALFHVVVDTADTAALILDKMNAEKRQGRVTFIPMDSLKSQSANLPRTDEAFPLIDKLSSNPMFRPVLEQVFGKTVLARDMDVATAYSREYNVHTITMDGDQVSKRGIMTGGSYDTHRSRLDTMKNIKHWRTKLEEMRSSTSGFKEELATLDQQITALVSEIQKGEMRIAQSREEEAREQRELRQATDSCVSYERYQQESSVALNELEVQIRRMEEQLDSMKQELGTDLSASELSDAEKEELETLQGQLEETKEALVKISGQRAELETSIVELRTKLHENLYRRRDTIQATMQDVSVDDRRLQVDSEKHRLQEISKSISERQHMITELENRVRSNEGMQKKLHTDIENLKGQETDRHAEQQSQEKQMERLLNKRNLLVRKKEEATQKIRDLGTIPSTVEQFQSLGPKQLMKKLHATNEHLKKYAHVNKKALDQYLKFSEQKESLEQQKDQLDSGAQAIRDLVSHLDHKKDEAIERTFKQVARNFQAVFQELVPSGYGRLVMQKARPKDEEGAENEEGQDAEADAATQHVLQYRGVSVKVAFTDGVEPRLMEQLSGGQKSVVALAMIFAIQRCDPAPFYLFDEIDAALDSVYRTAVAGMIRRQCGQTQFIVTTFRPELVEAAERHYLVTYQNKVSRINVGDMPSAMDIVAQEDLQAEAETAAAQDMSSADADTMGHNSIVSQSVR